MKNTITIIYTTIFSLLFITVIFTIAELNIIAKTPFDNQLQQSVVMSASYLIICKLIIQIAITYIAGNVLYHKIKDIHSNNTNHSKTKMAWEDCVETKSEARYVNEPLIDKEQYLKTKDSIMKGDISGRLEDLTTRPLTPNEAFKSTPIDKEVFDKVSELKFDPVDQIDEIDKSNISIEKEGTILSDLLLGISKNAHTFTKRQLRDNKRWKLIGYPDASTVDFEVIVINKKNQYYVEVEEKLVEPKGRLLSDILGEKPDSHSFIEEQIRINKRYKEVPSILQVTDDCGCIRNGIIYKYYVAIN
jgi:hypothetical protein